MTIAACARVTVAEAPVQDLLDRWAAALRADDVDALRDLVDSGAEPGVLDRQLDRATDMSGIPFADFGFELAPEQVSDTEPSVYLRYAIEGADPASTRKPMSIVVARRDDGWKLVSDAGAWHGPWDFGPVVAIRAGNSVVLGHPDQQSLVDAIAAELPAAVDGVTDVWGPQWRRAVVVFVTGSPAEFAALGGVSDPAVAAVSVSDEVVAGTPPTGQRIVFSPEAATRLTESTRRSVLRHELTHVAARAETVTGSPTWVLEGFADFVGYRDSDLPFNRIAPNLVRTNQPVTFPDDAEFAADTAVVAYEKAWSAWAFLADAFGTETAVQLYRSLARGPADAWRIDAELRETLGVSTVDFVAAWNEWLRRRIGG